MQTFSENFFFKDQGLSEHNETITEEFVGPFFQGLGQILKICENFAP